MSDQMKSLYTELLQSYREFMTERMGDPMEFDDPKEFAKAYKVWRASAIHTAYEVVLEMFEESVEEVLARMSPEERETPGATQAARMTVLTQYVLTGRAGDLVDDVVGMNDDTEMFGQVMDGIFDG